MRILHTSDWHIGRTFHKNPTLDALREVLNALTAIAVEQGVDVVVAAGDIFDSSTPSAAATQLLDEALLDLYHAGVRIVMTSGNHDSPARLGAKAVFAHQAGVHVLTETDAVAAPVTIADEHGDVHFYGVPYIEPALQRHRWTDAEKMRSQQDALRYALDLVQADWTGRGGRAVVLAHTFVAGAEGESCDSERDIVGGVDKVPVSYFTPFTYAALGHIHGRATLADNVRYSGAPLHYSFSEQHKPRGGWLVDLDGAGLAKVEWVDLPVPRPLSTISGPLESLLADAAFADCEDHWICAVVTDPKRPQNTQRRLLERFPYVAEIRFEPSETYDAGVASYAEKVVGRSDLEVVETFVRDVRNGVAPTEGERDVIRDVIAAGRPA